MLSSVKEMMAFGGKRERGAEKLNVPNQPLVFVLDAAMGGV